MTEEEKKYELNGGVKAAIQNHRRKEKEKEKETESSDSKGKQEQKTKKSKKSVAQKAEDDF